LHRTCRRAFAAFADRARLATVRGNAMSRRSGWSLAARHYETLYQRTLTLPASFRSRPLPGRLARHAQARGPAVKKASAMPMLAETWEVAEGRQHIWKQRRHLAALPMGGAR